jgi:hypothetical protein
MSVAAKISKVKAYGPVPDGANTTLLVTLLIGTDIAELL